MRLLISRHKLLDRFLNDRICAFPRQAAFGLRQQGTFSLFVAGFAPYGAQSRQQKDGIYHSAEGQERRRRKPCQR
jgi:hypothetical protein